MNDCAACRDRLLDWLDDALDAPTLAAVDDHLGECGPCACEALGLRRASRLVVAASRVEPDPGLAARILGEARARGLIEAPAAAPAAPRAARPPLWAAAAAVLAAAALGWAFAPRPVRVVEGPVREVVVEVPARSEDPATPTRPAPPGPPRSPEAVREFWTAAWVREQ